MTPAFSIFVSSPGDVGREREIASRVIARLRGEFSGRIALNAYFWEQEPMDNSATFQEQIPPPSEFDLVICILWSRLGTPLTDGQGRQWRSGTEYEVAVARESTHTQVMVFINQTPAQIRQLPAEERERMFQQLRDLESFISTYCYDPKTKIVHGAYTHYRDLGTFEDRLEQHLRALIEKSGRAAPPTAASMRPTWTDGSPFRRLEAFDTRHAPVFFGRTRAVGEVLLALGRRVQEMEEWMAREEGGNPNSVDAGPQPAAFLLISAMSGVGKSSLVRAGVLPLLVQPGHGVGHWRQAILRPGGTGEDRTAEPSTSGRLFLPLASGLIEDRAVPELLRPGWTVARLAQTLRNEPAAVGQMVAQSLHAVSLVAATERKARMRAEAARLKAEGRELDAQRGLEQVELTGPFPARLALVVDQLEEIFTLEGVTDEERTAFITALATMARSGSICVLATLRSDFFHRCAEIPALMQIKQGAGLYHLEPPRIYELAQIIRQPARAAALIFEGPTTVERQVEGRLEKVPLPSLDERILEDAQRHPEALPLLEFCLDELWGRRSEDGKLTHDAYEKIGTLTGGIGAAAEGALRKATGDPETAAVRRALDRLFRAVTKVDPHHESVFTRSWSGIEELAGADTVTESILNALLAPDCRLFVADMTPAGRATVTVAHEALLTQWGRLHQWLKDNRDLLQMRDQVRDAAADWRTEASKPHGRPDDLLLASGLPLARAERVLRAGFLDETERRFVEQSVTRESDARELEKRQAEEAHQRKRRMLRALLASAAVIAVVLAGLWRHADRSADLAKLRADQVERLLAESDVERAEQLFGQDEGLEAVKLLRRAVASGAAPSEAKERLWFALTQRSWPQPLSQPREVGGHVLALAFDPAGGRFAAATRDGRVVLAPVDSAGPPTELAHPRAVRCVRFSPEGTRLVSGCSDGLARLWSLGGTQPVSLGTARHEDEVLALAWAPDGLAFATGSRDKSVRVWLTQRPEQPVFSAAMGHAVHTIAYDPSSPKRLMGVAKDQVRIWDLTTNGVVCQHHASADLNGAVFSPDGSRIAAFDDDGDVVVIETATEHPLRTLHLEEACHDAGFSPDGRFLATASGNRLALHDLQGSVSALWTTEHKDRVAKLGFSRDGGRIVTACDDGRVQVWETGQGRRVSEPIQEAGALVAMGFHSGGNRVLTARPGGVVRAWELRLPLTPPAGRFELAAPVVGLTTHRQGLLALDRLGKGFEATPGEETWSVRRFDVGESSEVACLSSDGRSLIVGAVSGKVLKVDESGQVTEQHKFDTAVTHLAFSPGGQFLAAGTEGGSVASWVWPGLAPRSDLHGHGGKLAGLAFLSESGPLLSAGWDQQAHFSPVGSNPSHEVFTSRPLVADPSFIAASANGQSVFIALESGRFLQARGGNSEVFEAFSTRAAPAAAAVTEDGLLAATATVAGSLVVWDAPSRTKLAELSTGDSGLSCLVFSRDGRWLAGGAEEGWARVWSVHGLRPVTEPLRHRAPIRHLAFVDGGSQLCSASRDGVVHVWELRVPGDGSGASSAIERGDQPKSGATLATAPPADQRPRWRSYLESLHANNSDRSREELKFLEGCLETGNPLHPGAGAK